jgi:hypothetical protein
MSRDAIIARRRAYLVLRRINAEAAWIEECNEGSDWGGATPDQKTIERSLSRIMVGVGQLVALVEKAAKGGES